MTCTVWVGATLGELHKYMFVISAGCNIPSARYLGQEKGEVILEASTFPFCQSDPSFTGQKARVCGLAAAKYIHPNYLLGDKVRDQMVSL